MGEKDLTEKILEDYNDVFADIINAFVFEGKDVVHPDSLRNSSVHSQYKASDQKLHELERDVAKYWMDGNVRIALCGMENQTKVEKFMPFRVFSYDGTAYRSQLLDRKNKIVPVITIVLYFGNEHWTAPKSIKELLDIPAGLDEYVSDYNIHVFEIAWLTDEQIARFKSDFGIVARFFSERRKNPDYVPDDQTVITHVDAMVNYSRRCRRAFAAREGRSQREAWNTPPGESLPRYSRLACFPAGKQVEARQLEGGYHSELSNYGAVPFMSAGEDRAFFRGFLC